MTQPTTDPRDTFNARPVSQRSTVYEGMVWNIGRDTVDFADGVQFDREYVDHPGAVAILAFDTHGDLILIRQYRHPVGATLWEIPAGLLDQEGEDDAAAAVRELAEETGYRAGTVHHVTDFFPSPGGSTELIRVYVTFGCTPDAMTDFERRDEEAELTIATVPWERVLEAALSGHITNGTTLIAILALAARREWSSTPLAGPDTKRPQDR